MSFQTWQTWATGLPDVLFAKGPNLVQKRAKL